MPKQKNYPKIDGFRISDKAAPDYIKKGFKSWVDQKQRCSNPNDPRYKYSGERGIQVEYSSYEFVLWFKEQWFKKDKWNRPNVSRINHAKNYSFENIELLECSENSKERVERLGTGREKIPVVARNIITGECRKFNNMRKAAKELEIARSYLSMRLKSDDRKTPAKGWIFM